MSKSKAGKLGRQLHEDLFNLVRSAVLSKLRKEHPEWEIGGTASEQIFLLLSGQSGEDGKRRVGSLIPDLALHESTTQDSVLIEIGEFNPCKWGEGTPVIHIGFNGNVSRINFPLEGITPFQLALAATIRREIDRAQFKGEIELELPPRPDLELTP